MLIFLRDISIVRLYWEEENDPVSGIAHQWRRQQLNLHNFRFPVCCALLDNLPQLASSALYPQYLLLSLTGDDI